MFKLKFPAEQAFKDKILVKKTSKCTSRRTFSLLLVNREQRCLTSKALAAGD